MIVNSDQTSFLFGKLTWESIPLHEPILVATFAAVALGGIAVVGALTYFRLWGYLWNEWFTSIDHKKIGIMYIILALVMLLRGFADAIMMRVQQAIASGGSEGYLPPHHYDQIFTAHGVIMIFFMAMPMITGLMNFVVPLQIGARDVSFPFLNNFSFWYQPDSHDHQDARTWHDNDAPADLRLDVAVFEHPDRGILPDPHRHARPSDP